MITSLLEKDYWKRITRDNWRLLGVTLTVDLSWALAGGNECMPCDPDYVDINNHVIWIAHACVI